MDLIRVTVERREFHHNIGASRFCVLCIIDLNRNPLERRQNLVAKRGYHRRENF